MTVRPTLVAVPEPDSQASDDIETVDHAEAISDRLPVRALGEAITNPHEEPARPDVAQPEPEAPKVSSVASEAPLRTPTPRKRPARPTNKEMLQQALKALDRVEDRLSHLEEEVTGIDEAVRNNPGPPSSNDDDDLTPPPSGFVGYI